MKSAAETISFDDAVELLADVRRRKLLVALVERDPGADGPAVVADAAGGPGADDAVSMQHVHLPKLADYGVIEWNERTNEVRRGPNFDEVGALVELLDSHADELPDDWL